jgi:hypothetical protein
MVGNANPASVAYKMADFGPFGTPEDMIIFPFELYVPHGIKGWTGIPIFREALAKLSLSVNIVVRERD